MSDATVWTYEARRKALLHPFYEVAEMLAARGCDAAVRVMVFPARVPEFGEACVRLLWGPYAPINRWTIAVSIDNQVVDLASLNETGLAELAPALPELVKRAIAAPAKATEAVARQQVFFEEAKALAAAPKGAAADE